EGGKRRGHERAKEGRGRRHWIIPPARGDGPPLRIRPGEPIAGGAQAPPAPRIAMASTSTRRSGAARARTSTSVETGKSPEKTSRRAFHTSSRRLMSVT